MDYFVAVEASCPPAIVQKAVELNPARFESGEPLFQIAFSDSSPECLSSVVGFVAPKVMENSNKNFVANFLKLAVRVADTNIPEVRGALREMAQRIGPDPFYVEHFYKMLNVNEIDLTESFPAVPAKLWVASEAPKRNDAFYRAIYLVQMNVPEAEKNFAEGLAVLATSVDSLQRHFRIVIDELDHQTAVRLLHPYIDDPRRPRGLFGPDYSIGRNIRQGLGLALNEAD